MSKLILSFETVNALLNRIFRVIKLLFEFSH